MSDQLEQIGKGTIAAEDLRRYVDRIEQATAQVDDAKQDVKDLYTEVKSKGYNPKMVRKVIAERKKTKEQRDEELALMEMYFHALGLD